MDKEFGGFRSEKSGGVNGNSATNNNASSASLSNLGKEKLPFTITDTAFIEVSQSTSVRNYENSTETHGTYRSRNNNGYDSTADVDLNSMSRKAVANGGGGGGDSTPPLSRQVSPPPPPLSTPAAGGAKSTRPRVDHDEYWRTNI